MTTTTRAARRKAKGAVDLAREARPAKGVGRLVGVPEDLRPVDRGRQHVARKVERLDLAPVQALAVEAALRCRVGVYRAELIYCFAFVDYSALVGFALTGDGGSLHIKI